jgi:integrase/recombinase XerD
MNRGPQNITISKAIDGFTKFKMAEGLSPRSVNSYEFLLNQWLNHIGDKPVSEISSQDITAYLAWLRTDYQPRRFNGQTNPLSPKTIRNTWITLMSFFGWLNREFKIPNPVKGISAPRYQKAQPQPFTREEVELLLKACLYSRDAETKIRHSFFMRRPTASRDQTIIMILLDTGLRVSELCSLKVDDVDLKTGRVNVKHGQLGGAKGGKGRTVFMGKATRKALWRYLASREDGEKPDAPLVLSKEDRPMTRNGVRLLITSIGERAGVKKTYPHRFRHTMAINYLRAGGDVFTLQALLGHSSLDMVRHYAQIAEIDIEEAHRKASPVDNWRL